MTEGTGYMTKLQQISQKYMALSVCVRFAAMRGGCSCRRMWLTVLGCAFYTARSKRAKALEDVLARIEQQRQAVIKKSTACTKRAQGVERDVSTKLGLRGAN